MYPPDLCDYLFYTNVYAYDARILATDNYRTWTLFQRMAAKRANTELGISFSFDSRFGLTRLRLTIQSRESSEVFPLNEDAKAIHLNIVNKRNPTALAAKRLSSATSVIVAFDGGRVPTWVYYGSAMLRCTFYRKQIDVCHQCGRVGHRMDVCPNPQDRVCRGCRASIPDPNHKCTPTCRLSGGAHPTTDKACKARFKTPYLVKKRRGDRRRATAEAALELQQQYYDEEFTPASRSRSRARSAGPRSRQQSQSRSRSRSRTPGTESWPFEFAASEASRSPGPGPT
ncbi:hypothetical protein MTO96_050415 [Rhipicephalus appendiculatus]